MFCALAAPDVEDVGCSFLVVAAIGALRLDEAMACIEALRSGVRGERPEPEAVRAFTFGELYQPSADAASCQRRLHVELFEPWSFQDENADRRACFVHREPQFRVADDV